MDACGTSAELRNGENKLDPDVGFWSTDKKNLRQNDLAWSVKADLFGPKSSTGTNLETNYLLFHLGRSGEEPGLKAWN